MRMITGQLGPSILWTMATSVALAASSPNAVEWKDYRYYFPNNINALGLGRPFAGLSGPAFNVVHSESEWSAFWEPFFKPRSEVAASITPYPPIPEPPIDFDKFTLVVASSGTKPTGGYSIKIESIRDDESALVVILVETVPGKTCATTQTFTRPTAMALIPRTTKQVEFEVSTTTFDCGP
jgi:hypothetical protein